MEREETCRKINSQDLKGTETFCTTVSVLAHGRLDLVRKLYTCVLLHMKYKIKY